ARRWTAPYRPRPTRRGGRCFGGTRPGRGRGLAAPGDAEQALRGSGQTAVLCGPDDGGGGRRTGHLASDGPPLLGLRPGLAVRCTGPRVMTPGSFLKKTALRWQTGGPNGALSIRAERGG